MSELNENQTARVPAVDFLLQLVVAAVIPTMLLWSSSLLFSSSFGFFQGICLLTGGPVAVIGLMLIFVAELAWTGYEGTGAPMTNLQFLFLVLLSGGTRGYLLLLTVKFSRRETRLLVGHGLNLFVTLAFALTGASFIAMSQQ